MNWPLEIALIGLLVIAFFQDRGSRSIHVIVFAGLLSLSLLNFVQTGFSWSLVLINAGFVLAILVCLTAYLSIKESRLINIFRAHFGVGDMVYFLAVTPLFSTNNFIIYFITGIVFSGATHLIVSQNRSGDTVPLAGYLSVYLIGLKLIDLATAYDFLYTDVI